MEGFRILEVAEHTFVPAASALLADWGADVIKVEHAERGDALRGLASTGVMELGDQVNVLVEHSNRGKKSLGLDLTTPEGVEILYELAATADVFLTNKMEGVRRKLKIDVEDIRRANPDIVYVQGTGYGTRGPDADRGGYDFLGFWCRSGAAAGANYADEDRMRSQPAPAYGDSIGAMTIAGGIAGALLHRERTGEALVVDVSLLGVGMWAMGAAVALSLQTGEPWRQLELGGPDLRNPLTRFYRTGDDRWIGMNCLQAAHYWGEFCGLLDRSDLIDDERFSTHEALTANAYEASLIIEQELAARTLDEVVRLLDGFSGQWAPVRDTTELRDDTQVAANGFLGETVSSTGVPFDLVTSPVQFGGQPVPPHRAPDFNEHGDQLLVEELGLGWDRIIELKTRGVVA